MSAGWVAAGVRARGLARRRLGRDGALDLAASDTLVAALGTLANTPYGREVKTAMDLASAEHAVFATLLWHMRILAGWGPPLGSGPLRLLATGFEVANVTGRLARIGGQNAAPPYALGSMATAWPVVSEAQTPSEVRGALASSSWGDPGGEDLATVRLALLLGWARRVLDGVPGAADWAISGSALRAVQGAHGRCVFGAGPHCRPRCPPSLGFGLARGLITGWACPTCPQGGSQGSRGRLGSRRLVARRGSMVVDPRGLRCCAGGALDPGRVLERWGGRSSRC